RGGGAARCGGPGSVVSDRFAAGRPPSRDAYPRRVSSSRYHIALIVWVLAGAACSRDQVPHTSESSTPPASAPPVALPPSTGSNGDSLPQAMAALEESLRVHADDPPFASLYLRPGRLKPAYEPCLASGAPTQ